MSEQAQIANGPTSRRTSRAAWLLLGLSGALMLMAIGIEVAMLAAGQRVDARALPANSAMPVNIAGMIVLLTFPLVGALIAAHRPRNPIGWLFCGVGASWAIYAFVDTYASYALVVSPTPLPGGVAAAWLANWLSGVNVFTIAVLLPLLFPDGRLLSRRWRWVAWLTVAGLASWILYYALNPGPIDDHPYATNPLGIETLSRTREIIGTIGNGTLLVLVLVAAVSAILRLKRAQGEERQQLKWFAYAAGMVGVVFIIAFVLLLTIDVSQTVLGAGLVVALAGIPVATGIAILRYRLWDIDLLINRTLVYVPLTAILAGLYTASVGLCQRLFVAFTGNTSNAAIVLTTLVVASAFTPIKNGLQATVDRRFKEAPDPTRVLRTYDQGVQAVLCVLDTRLALRRALDMAMRAFDAEGGAIFLAEEGDLRAIHTSGNWESAAVYLPIEMAGSPPGLLALGPRRGGLGYPEADLQALKQVLNGIAQVAAILAAMSTTSLATASSAEPAIAEPLNDPAHQ